MSKRGPKIRTASNSRAVAGAVRSRLECPSYLSERARAEYSRLVDVLDVRRAACVRPTRA